MSSKWGSRRAWRWIGLTALFLVLLFPSLEHQRRRQLLIGRWEGRGKESFTSVAEWVEVFNRDGTFRLYYGSKSILVAEGTYSFQGIFFLKTHKTGMWNLMAPNSPRVDTGPGYDGDTSVIDSEFKVWINWRGDEMTLQHNDPPAFRRHPAYQPRPAVRYRRLRSDEKAGAK